MTLYKRGNTFPLEIQSQFGFTKADLRKYWLVDSNGFPVGKPFIRKCEIELLQSLKPDEKYQIISNPIGKPKSEGSAKEKAIAYERKRSQDPKRKAYKARLARERYKVKNK